MHDDKKIPSIAILYRAVIFETFRDLLTRSKRTSDRIAQVEAYHLFFHLKHYQELKCLCSFASLPVNLVIKVAKKLLQTHKTHKIVILGAKIMMKKHHRPMIERKLFVTL